MKMKNISAAELNFDSEEITNDRGRFREKYGRQRPALQSSRVLQNCRAETKISTEADLFKVELRFRLK